MKVISIRGLTQSGKTSTAETIIKGLTKRGYSVGSVKEIHFEKFAIDTEGTNTHRHKVAGSKLVTALGMYETDILFQEKLPIRKILSFYDYDYIILEGVNDPSIPKIITAHNEEEVSLRFDDTVFAFSGRLADLMSECRGLPVIHPFNEEERLVDFVIENAFDLLPNFSKKCCGLCGFSCGEMCEKIVRKEKDINDCVLKSNNISLKINGKEITMVPFVQNILKNAVNGVVSELEGYSESSKVEIMIGLDKVNE